MSFLLVDQILICKEVQIREEILWKSNKLSMKKKSACSCAIDILILMNFFGEKLLVMFLILFQNQISCYVYIIFHRDSLICKTYKK